MMGPRTNEEVEASVSRTIDTSLTRPLMPDISVDQLMRAVEGVRPYVGSRLARYGLVQDLNDVLQDIRMAAWDGSLRGSYHAFPDVKFDAWVQGIACNLCADHLRRSFAKQTVPLVDCPVHGSHEVADLATNRRRDPVSEAVTGGLWAADILRIVKEHVTPATWELAMESLLRKSNGGDGGEVRVADSKHWHALTMVRQMAVTVRNAKDVDPEIVVDLESLRTASIASLPTPLLQLIAERVVVTAVRGKDRAAVGAVVAQESGVSSRYVEVQVGLVRSMVRAAEQILRAGTGIKGSVIPTSTKRPAKAALKVPDCTVTGRSHVREIAAS
ncbi:RNA polymerase sigma factor [Arthrobacter dokdonensis]|uniref:hypothetical protein n=1 Tax=Arthrobacter dokdonellae TaxID=2211210 RepID=UPI001494AE02|nr:hypothetical protein [Arthrobacter dokdonellae]